MTSLRKTAFVPLNIVAAAMMFSVPAAAENFFDNFMQGSPYVGGSVSYNWVEDADLGGAGLPANTEIEFDSDVGAVGAVGWHFSNGLRAELEFSYLDVDIDTISGGGLSAAATGSVEAYSGMFNLLYELDLDGHSIRHLDRFHPYVGAGIGFSNIDATLTIGGVTGSDDDTVFAYQFIGGLAIDVTDTISITTDYRYFATEDPDFGVVDAEFAAHKFTAGLRFTLSYK